jgi:rhodanese-related sulfurtransferase
MTGVTTSPVGEVAERHRRGEIQLVDVRTIEEWEGAHVPGARHVPIETITAEPDGFDRSQPVVFYCRAGDRSASVAQAFAASGWDATSLDGGILGWREQGQPIEPEDGEIGESSGLPPA